MAKIETRQLRHREVCEHEVEVAGIPTEESQCVHRIHAHGDLVLQEPQQSSDVRDSLIVVHDEHATKRCSHDLGRCAVGDRVRYGRSRVHRQEHPKTGIAARNTVDRHRAAVPLHCDRSEGNGDVRMESDAQVDVRKKGRSEQVECRLHHFCDATTVRVGRRG